MVGTATTTRNGKGASATNAWLPKGWRSITVTAIVKNASNVGMPNTAVTWGTSTGNLTGTTVTTDADGQPIAGLFAAGRCACGLPRWGEGYSSGMSLGDSTYFGREAGRAAARR